MPSRQEIKDLVKLRVLAYLSLPEKAAHGAVYEDIRRNVTGERLVTLKALLPEMIEEGFVERRTDTANQNAKPYFITEKGKEYLEHATEKAIFPEITQRDDWSTRYGTRDVPEAILAHISSLPEFREASNARCEQVAAQLAEIASKGKDSRRSTP